jgi:hypothetical protein
MIAIVDPVRAAGPSMPDDPSIAGDRLLFDATVRHVRDMAAAGLRARRFAHGLGLELRRGGNPPIAMLRAREFRARLRAVAAPFGRSSEHANRRLLTDLAAGRNGEPFDPDPRLYFAANSLRSSRRIVERGARRHGWRAPEDVMALLESRSHDKHRSRTARRRPGL